MRGKPGKCLNHDKYCKEADDLGKGLELQPIGTRGSRIYTSEKQAAPELQIDYHKRAPKFESFSKAALKWFNESHYN